MRSIVLCLAIFSSLVTASTCSRDAKDHPIDSALPFSNTPTPNNVKHHVHIGALNSGCPTDEYSCPCPSNTQLAPSQDGWHVLAVSITTILLVSIIWPLWTYLANNVQINRLAHRAGRSQAVSGPAPEVAPEDSLPQRDTNFAKAWPLHKRSGAVAFADNPLPSIPILDRVTEPLTSTSEETEVLDDVTVNPPASPRVHALQRFTIAGRRILQTWGWPPTRESETTVVCLAIRRRCPYSLLRSLHKGNRDLGENLELEQCIFFLVGVDTPGHEDAENDIKYLQQVLQSPARGLPPRYQVIYGPNVTRAKICETMRILVGKARAMLAPRMFMLFTGTGNEGNRMRLSNGETLSESDLIDRLSSADQAGKPTLSMFFDICRVAILQLAVNFRRVEMAWSCSMGEFAYAINLSKEDKPFPRSIFLLAIFLAAHHTNLHNQDSRFFEAAFTHHINQLSEFIRFVYDRRHQPRCDHCAPDQQCDPPAPQKPDLQYAGRAVTSLGMLIATYFPQHARQVFDDVDRRMFDGGFPTRLCPLSDLDAVQAVASAGGDGSYLDPHKASRAKAGLASAEAESPQAYQLSI